MVRFPYRREASRLLGEILRPVASVSVKSLRGVWFPTLMYVDSGADLTLVPRDFGRLLGMDLRKNVGTIGGLTGDTLSISIHQTEFKIGRSVAEAKLAVALKNNIPYLLGREGLFRLFKITFQEYESLVRFDAPT